MGERDEFRKLWPNSPGTKLYSPPPSARTPPAMESEMTEPTLRTQIVAAIMGLLKPAVKLERSSIEELERILNPETEDAVHINPDGTIDRQEPITTTVGAVADVVLAAVAAAVRGMETKARPGYCAGDKAKLGAGDCPVCGNSSDQNCPYGDYSDYSGIADRLAAAPLSAIPPSAPAVTEEEIADLIEANTGVSAIDGRLRVVNAEIAARAIITRATGSGA